MTRSLEGAVSGIARQLAELGAGERSKVFRMSWWSERMLDWAMARPEFKTQLFRFVDVFPALAGNEDVAGHLAEYFDGIAVPRVLDLGVDVAERVPFGRTIEARVARRNIMRMAEQFIVGQTRGRGGRRAAPALALRFGGHRRSARGEDDRRRGGRPVRGAGRRARSERSPLRPRHWAPDDHLERDDLGRIPRVNVSIKPTALAAHYEPLTRRVGLEQAKARIRPLLQLASAHGAFVHFDMEHYDAKDLTLQLFRELLTEPEIVDMEAGIVIQAYTKDSRDDLADLIAFSAGRRTPITVRLVKGAYWDTETVHARAAGWPVPVFEHKAETDANFERCVRLLHDHHGEVRAAFGTHNLRSLAYAVAYARSERHPRHRVRGADALRHGRADAGRGQAPRSALARVRAGRRARARDGVPRASPAREHVQRELRAPPLRRGPPTRRAAGATRCRHAARARPEPDDHEARRPDPATRRRTSPSRVSEWRRSAARASFAVAVDAGGVGAGSRRSRADRRRAGAHRVDDRQRRSRPLRTCRGAERVVRLRPCGRGSRRRRPRASSDGGRRPRPSGPVSCSAPPAWMRARRDELAALEVFEAGKPWDQADADVCEAIDFCEYYGREVLRLDREAAILVQSPPGERNRLTYQGKGVAVVISPWNFPLAIPCGMTAAALVAGNPTILKPAEQTPAHGVAAGRGVHGRGAAGRRASSSFRATARTSARTSSSIPTSRSSPSRDPRRSDCTSTTSPRSRARASDT